MTGIITQGASVTGCLITFRLSYTQPICSVTPRTGNPVTSVTESSAALAWTNAAVTGAAYTYSCVDGY
jgi:hypothetical protein